MRKIVSYLSLSAATLKPLYPAGMSDPLTAALGLAGLALGAIVAAAALRAMRVPGAAIAGGAVAGLLLGPSLLGRIAPETFEHTFVGGVEQRETRDALHRAQQIDRSAGVAGGIDPELAEQMAIDHAAALEAAVAEWEQAKHAFQLPQRATVALAVLAALLLGGVARVPNDGPAPNAIITSSIGLWSSLLPGGVAYLLLARVFGYDLPTAMLGAAAVAIGPWMLTGFDERSGHDAERGGARLMQSAGRVASVVALIAAAAALGLAGASWWWIALLAGMPLGWLVPGRVPTRHRPPGAEILLLPVLAALTALRVEIFQHWAWWPVIAFVLLSGDGRWLGALIGALLPGGRHALRTMRLVLGVMAAGPTQLCIAAIAAYAGLADGTLLLALLIGAVLVEMTGPVRRNAATRLVETEEMLEGVE